MAAGTRSHARRWVMATIVALVVGLALAGCSGGDDAKTASPSTTTAAPGTKVDIPLGDVSTDSAGGPVTIAPDQSQHVLDALITYVKGASVQPLRTGKPATADFGAIFDANTLASATTTDRGVLIDEGLPRVTGELDATAQPVTLLGLGDQGGTLTLISAAFLVDVTGATKVKGEPLHIVRKADFVLQPDASGAWKITSYDVVVVRDGAGLSPTTTSAAAPTTGASK
jgi:hypothetical protein